MENPLPQQHVLDEVPVIDVSKFLKRDENYEQECKKVADSLHQYGILIWRDPRVNEQDNEDYLDLMENYFSTTSKKYYEGKNLEDCKPEFNF